MPKKSAWCVRFAHASALRAQVVVVALHEDMTLTKPIDPSRRWKHCYDFGLDARPILWHNFRLPSQEGKAVDAGVLCECPQDG
ncbi:hypothetical protein THIX_60320 [Thiomonas sp. X19]|nr:hypothetical protein THIX_60320 [Thiomonas sp. X19]